MGKRKRNSARRMHKKPKPSSVSPSSSGGGGPASRTPSSAPPSSGGGKQVPAGTTTPSSVSSGTSGNAGATGGTPSPSTHWMGTPPSTSSRSSSSSGGSSAAYIPSMAPPTFLTRRGPVPKPHSHYDDRYAEAERLLSHFETHCKGAAEELWATSKWHLKIDFTEFRDQDRPLSHQICNQYERGGGKEFYISALRTFLLDHLQTKSLDGRFDSVDALKSHIETHANLSFTRMPKSITTFSAIRKSKIVKIFAGEKKIALEAVEATDLGRKVLCQIVEYILDAHKNKNICWDGNWTADDWDVINDNFVSLVKQPIRRIGREHSDKDLVQIASSILPTFLFSGCLPSFMEHLQDQLTKPKVQYDVFWYNNTPNSTTMPHEQTYGGMLGYHRHLVQHSPDNGRIKKVKGAVTQAMTNSDEAELIAVLHNAKLLPELIKKLFVNNMMTRPEFLKHWLAYVATRFLQT